MSKRFKNTQKNLTRRSLDVLRPSSSNLSVPQPPSVHPPPPPLPGAGQAIGLDFTGVVVVVLFVVGIGGWESLLFAISLVGTLEEGAGRLAVGNRGGTKEEGAVGGGEKGLTDRSPPPPPRAFCKL